MRPESHLLIRLIRLIGRLVAGWLLLNLPVGFSVELRMKGWEGMGKRLGDMAVSPLQYPDGFDHCSVFTRTAAWAGAAVGGSTGVTLGLALVPAYLALEAYAKSKHPSERMYKSPKDRMYFIFAPAMVGTALGNVLGGMIAGAPFVVVEGTVDRLRGRWPPCHYGG